MRRFVLPTLIAVALAALTLAVFGRAWKNGFVNYDDPSYVIRNPHVQHGVNAADFRWAWETYAVSNWHPLTWLSLQLDYNLYGRGQPWSERLAWGYHLTNILIHAAAVALLFAVLRGMTGAVWRSAAVAAFVAVHPLHVESVAWVSERKDVLCALFGVAAVGAYARYARRPGVLRYLAVAALFALGLLSKPMLVTLPCVFLLLDYWPLDRFRLDKASAARRPWRKATRLVAEKLPLFAMSAYVSVRTWQAQAAAHSIRSLEQFPLPVRVGNAVLSYATYLGQTFWPARLAPFYPHPGPRLPWTPVLGAAVLLVAVTLIVWALSPRFRYLGVGWLWFLGMLLPVIGLTQTGPQAHDDRFTYLPHIGLFIMIVWAVGDLAAAGRWRRLLVPGTVAVVLVLCWRTWVQLGYWHDSVTLWQHALDVTRNNGVAETNLADALIQQDRLDEAVRHSLRALEIDPQDAQAHCQVGEVLVERGGLAEAEEHFVAALRAQPDYATPHRYLGFIYEAKGKLDEALEHDLEAVARAPGDVVACHNLAHVLSLEGRWSQAVPYYRRAVEFQPNDWRFRVGLAYVLYQEGRPDAARGQYAAALTLNPRWPQEFRQKSWGLATDPDARRRNGRVAVELAEKCCQATGGDKPEYLVTLAAAYAEAGRFEQAVATARKALAVARTPEERADVGRQLRDYQAKRPLRGVPD